MIIKVPKNDLFYTWLSWLSPIIPLTEIERKVLAAYITLHYLHKDRYSKEVLNELLMSEDTKKIVAKKLKINHSILNKVLKKFEDSKVMSKEGLNPSLTNYPRNNKFKIDVEFEVV